MGLVAAWRGQCLYPGAPSSPRPEPARWGGRWIERSDKTQRTVKNEILRTWHLLIQPQKLLNPPGEVRVADQFITEMYSLLRDKTWLTFPQAHRYFFAYQLGLNSFKVRVLPGSGYFWGL